MTGPPLGIVLPVYNEAAILERALEALRALAGDCSVVPVDGGSTDSSAQIVRRYFRAEQCQWANRGAQMNHGARFVDTEVLLFLHADSRLPPGFEGHIRRALSDPRVVGGCFQLRFDDPHPLLRFYAWFTRYPGRCFHFGDQSFFVRRKVFWKVEGYRQLPFLEDLDFLRQLSRCGRFAVLPVPVVTSARRFLRCGIVRQQLLNVLLVALFELGVSAERLCRLDPHVR